jgi:hypothetical protein
VLARNTHQPQATFENEGFGVVHHPAAGFSGIYPQHTMQFMAVLQDPALLSSVSSNADCAPPAATGGQPTAIYCGAHDPRAESKSMGLQLSARRGAAFQFAATPPGAGQAGASPYTVAYPVVVKPVKGGWWDAAQVYRAWVLSAATTWTSQGPMRTRNPPLAPWMFNLTTWVNSHWQGLDIFNRTGGDPEVVANRVLSIVERFGLARDALALHWCALFLKASGGVGKQLAAWRNRVCDGGGAWCLVVVVVVVWCGGQGWCWLTVAWHARRRAGDFPLRCLPVLEQVRVGHAGLRTGQQLQQLHDGGDVWLRHSLSRVLPCASCGS